MGDFVLTADNYYSAEANEHYMSFHTFTGYYSHGGIEGCEARAEAIRRGEWAEETTKAMLVGSYVDAYFEGTLDDFRKEHKEIFLKDGVTLKSEFRQAEVMIKRCEQDEYFMKTMSGEKQVIMTGEWEGVQWKIKIDSYLRDKAIVDLKTSSDLHKAWRNANGSYSSSMEHWFYEGQLALYQKIVEVNTGLKLPCFLSIVTKEDSPDIEVVGIDQDTLDNALAEIKEALPSVMQVRRGEVEPIRCGRCDYCKATKKITKPISLMELIW